MAQATDSNVVPQTRSDPSSLCSMNVFVEELEEWSRSDPLASWTALVKAPKGEMFVSEVVIGGRKAGAYYDTCSTGNFISCACVERLHLQGRVQRLNRPVESTCANKQRMVVNDYLQDVECCFPYAGGELRHRVSFLVSDELPMDMLLGMHYLSVAQPQFNLDRKVVKHTLPGGGTARLHKFKASSLIESHGCMCAATFYNYYKQNQEEGMYLVYVSAAGKPVKMPPEIEGVVAKYPDLFEEPTGVVEREVVHAIEIIPGSSILKGRIYRMSPGELDELRRQLKELVEKGWIRPSVPPYGLEAKDKVTSAEFELVNGLLFLEKAGNKRLCVPNNECLRSLFLGECHNATGHFGYKKTAANLLQRFWWPTMMRDAQLYVETCQVCQRDKPRTQAPLGLLKPLPIPERPGESLSMDFMDTLVTSKSGMRHIFVIVDRFIKYARLVAMPETARTEYVIRMFKENWVRDFGLPKSIISDRDVRFTSELWKAAAAEQGTQLQMTSGNHLEANGQAEQLNRVVQHLLRHYIKPSQVEWDEKLALIASLYNNAVHSATGTSPNSLLLTFKPRLPLDFLFPENQSTSAPGTLEFAYRYEQKMQQVVEQMQKAQAAMIESVNKHRRESSFQVGDRVWVKSSELGQEHGISRKLMPQYFGPWEVLDIVGTDPDGPSYVVRIPGHLRTYPVFHASKLAPFKETNQFPSCHSMLAPTMDGEVDIDDIVDHRELPVARPTGRGRPLKPKLQYRVRFRHHIDPKEDRWFTSEELMQTAPQVVAHYERSLQKGKRPMIED
ncbi:hypothetical protein CBR_g12634 [Chara braunii]|uniref:Integrase catalytic domain-containing protein n=1 Tax=Chara braunii TaxID=69332 RepID=A0A388KS78_CHABU|nr:hypothetical protein CBR_g12634 [Chara braunii]|eukprot:GBG72914.1 hypothetical protein CBR_g12634 [Chara braunii]